MTIRAGQQVAQLLTSEIHGPFLVCLLFKKNRSKDSIDSLIQQQAKTQKYLTKPGDSASL